MIISNGVQMREVCRNIKKILKIIDSIFYEEGSRLIVKASKWGNDTFREAHEAGNAIDIDHALFHRQIIFTRIKLSLGLNYIIRDMKGHIHIEYAPLGKAPLPCKRSLNEIRKNGVLLC